MPFFGCQTVFLFIQINSSQFLDGWRLPWSLFVSLHSFRQCVDQCVIIDLTKCFRFFFDASRSIQKKYMLSMHWDSEIESTFQCNLHDFTSNILNFEIYTHVKRKAYQSHWFLIFNPQSWHKSFKCNLFNECTIDFLKIITFRRWQLNTVNHSNNNQYWNTNEQSISVGLLLFNFRIV